MRKQKILKDEERQQLIDALHDKYGSTGSMAQDFVYWRKKYAWILVIGGAKFLKRFLDIAVSVSMLIILSPLLLILAIAIKFYDGGPVLYTSQRVGKWGKVFNFRKFRTMRVGADQEREELKEYNKYHGDIRFKMEKDPRITKIGKILRKTSLDELPQLWNVLVGEMSLVGPRPPLVEEVDKYTLEQRRRLDITPGLTCIWQVSGRSEIPFSQQVKLDVEYIESQSIWFDILLLLKTIPAVLFGKGAY